MSVGSSRRENTSWHSAETRLGYNVTWVNLRPYVYDVYEFAGTRRKSQYKIILADVRHVAHGNAESPEEIECSLE